MSNACSTTRLSFQVRTLFNISFLGFIGIICIFVMFQYLDASPLKDWIYLRIALYKIGLSGLALYILCVATMPLAAPLSLLIMAGSSAYGAPLCIVLSYIGCVLNANLAYFLVKALGIEHSWGYGDRTGRLKNAVQENGYHLVLFLQLLTVIPFAVINSAAAASGVSWREFMKATLFGIIPSIAIFSLLGEAVTSEVFTPRFYVAVVCSIVLAITLGALLKKYAQARSKALT